MDLKNKLSRTGNKWGDTGKTERRKGNIEQNHNKEAVIIGSSDKGGEVCNVAEYHAGKKKQRKKMISWLPDNLYNL